MRSSRIPNLGLVLELRVRYPCESSIKPESCLRRKTFCCCLLNVRASYCATLCLWSCIGRHCSFPPTFQTWSKLLNHRRTSSVTYLIFHRRSRHIGIGQIIFVLPKKNKICRNFGPPRSNVFPWVRPYPSSVHHLIIQRCQQLPRTFLYLHTQIYGNCRQKNELYGNPENSQLKLRNSATLFNFEWKIIFRYEGNQI